MDTFTLIAIVMLILLALLVILLPLWQQSHSTSLLYADHTDPSLEEYEVRYQALLTSIRDLQFDYSLGKVSDEDYESLLTDAKLEAARVRKEMDRLLQSGTNPTLDAEIEALIAQTRSNSSAEDAALLQEVEAEIERLKNGQIDTPAALCSACGQNLHPDASFCSHCGQPVSPPDRYLCPQCGYNHQPDDAFCANCGATLTQKTKTPAAEKSK